MSEDLRVRPEPAARVRRGDIEAWAVLSDGKRILFAERERADLYVSTRSGVQVYPLVRARLLVEAIDRLVATQEALREERATIVVVNDSSEQITALRAELAALRAETAKRVA